jgi:hypothetical protein
MRPFRARHHVGEWLSLVEHLVRDQGVGGSNPLSPTNYLKRLERIQLRTFLGVIRTTGNCCSENM